MANKKNNQRAHHMGRSHPMAGWESPIHGHFNRPTYRTWGDFPTHHVQYHRSRYALCAASLARHGSGFFTSMVSLSMPGVPRAFDGELP